MNALIKPYFDQLIEDREYTHATGPKPLQVVQAYIECLETVIEDNLGKLDVCLIDDCHLMCDVKFKKKGE